MKQWFEGRTMVQELPQEAIADCTAQGECLPACASWIERIAFEAPITESRVYLKRELGIDETSLSDSEVTLLVFWQACHSMKEHGFFYLGS